MKISEAICQLEAVQAKHGDLPILGGAMSDGTPLRRFCVLDVRGAEVGVDYQTGKLWSAPHGVFLVA